MAMEVMSERVDERVIQDQESHVNKEDSGVSLCHVECESELTYLP